MLFVIFGLPFTGKRQLGRLLASHLSCNFISTSEIRNRWIAGPTYTLSEKRAVYLNLLQESAEALVSGRCLVLSGTFYRQEFREDMEKLSESFDKPIVWIHLSAVRTPISGYIANIYNESYAREIREKVEIRFQPITMEKVIYLDNKEKMDQVLSRIDKIVKDGLPKKVGS